MNKSLDSEELYLIHIYFFLPQDLQPMVKRKNTSSNRKNRQAATKIVEKSTDGRIEQQCEFQTMNDYCIIEIFKNLELKDLSAAANTCSRLQTLAQMAFSSKYRDQRVNLEESEEILEDCLRNFGSQMQSVRIQRPREIRFRDGGGIQVLSLLLKYCDSLKHLEVHDYSFLPGVNEEVKAMLSRTRFFCLSNCGMTYMSSECRSKCKRYNTKIFD